MALGHRAGDEPDERFNMAVMGLRLAGRSQRRVEAARRGQPRTCSPTCGPTCPTDEVPDHARSPTACTRRTWVSPEMSDLLDRHVLPEWAEAGAERWALHRRGRATTSCGGCASRAASGSSQFVRRRLRESRARPWRLGVRRGVVRRGARPRGPHHLLRPPLRHLQAGHLLLSQPERLLALLLLDADRPVQFVFAGKAHPADDARQGDDPADRRASPPTLDVRHRFVFLEDYDIAVARTLYHGADVWLNNPRRPLEACGTSGMKAALNGALNCSILDGWWDELFDGENGWAITLGRGASRTRTSATRSRPTASSSCSSARSCRCSTTATAAPCPGAGWRRIKHNLADARPGGARQPHGARLRRASSTSRPPPRPRRCGRPDLASARELAGVEGEGAGRVGRRAGRGGRDPRGPGRPRRRAPGHRGRRPRRPRRRRRRGAAPARPGRPERRDRPCLGRRDDAASRPTPSRWTAGFTCDRAGRYGYTVRIVPSHPDLTNPIDLGRIAWA